MPFKPITVRRWEAFLIVAALTVTFVVGLVALTRQTDAARRDAQQAKRVAQRQMAEDDRIKRNRDEQIRKLHAVDVRACRSTHRLDVVLRDLLERSIGQADAAERLPDLTPAQRRSLRELDAASLASLRRGVAQARTADCLGVPPIPAVGSAS